MLASSASATAGYSAAGSAWAIDPPSVPRLRIWKWPISGVALASSGTARRHLGAGLDGRLRGAGADPQRAVAALDALQLGDAPDVDEVLEDRQAQREHRDQALAAGQHLRAVAELGEQLRGVGGRARRVVLERRGLHGAHLRSGSGELRGPPAVDRDDRAADVGGAVRREERRDLRDLFRLARRGPAPPSRP